MTEPVEMGRMLATMLYAYIIPSILELETSLGYVMKPFQKDTHPVPQKTGLVGL